METEFLHWRSQRKKQPNGESNGILFKNVKEKWKEKRKKQQNLTEIFFF